MINNDTCGIQSKIFKSEFTNMQWSVLLSQARDQTDAILIVYRETKKKIGTNVFSIKKQVVITWI